MPEQATNPLPEPKKNPNGGANIAPGGPWDYTVNEELERAEAMKRHDLNVPGTKPPAQV